MNVSERKFTKQLVVLCDPEQVKRYDIASEIAGMGRSAWMRKVLDVRAGVEIQEHDNVVMRSKPPRVPVSKRDDSWESVVPTMAEMEKKRKGVQ